MGSDSKGSGIEGTVIRPTSGFIWGYNDSPEGGPGTKVPETYVKSVHMPWDESRDGAGRMVKGSNPVLAASVQERSVEATRRKIQDLKAHFKVFDVSLRSFGLTPDPEGRVRLGIAMGQIATYLREGMIIGYGPEISPGPDPGPLITKEVTRLALDKGFSWVEYGMDNDTSTVKSLRERSLQTGSMLLLRVDPALNTSKEVMSNLWGCDGVKVSASIESRKDLVNLTSMLEDLKRESATTPVFLRARGKYSGMVQSLSGMILADTVCIDTGSVVVEGVKNDLTLLKVERPRYSMSMTNLHLGLRDDLKGRTFSLKGRIIDRGTRLSFLFGHPISHALEPILHNKAFMAEGSPTIMVPVGCGVDAMDQCLMLIKEMEAIGAVVTMPIRSLIGKKLDEIDVQSKRLGAINVVKMDSGRLKGFNTEYFAALDVLKKYVEASVDFRVVVLGTGGAGRSIAAASADLGLNTYICGSNTERTIQLARTIGGKVGAIPIPSLGKLKGKVNILVNATPEGMVQKDEKGEGMMGVSDIARSLEPSFGIDMVYSPPWTPFLSSIESRGGIPISGFEVLVAEVVRSHHVLTGSSPSAEDLKLCAMDAHPLLISK